jgi:DNA-binding IclR family transcriptional regulator
VSIVDLKLPEPEATGQGTIRSLSKGLKLLELVITARKPMRLRDIAAALGYEPSTALRILATLEESGFVSKDEDSKLYSAGPTLARLRRFAPAQGLLIERLRPWLKHLNEVTGMTTYLGVLDHDEAMLIEVIAAKHIVSVRQLPGDKEPLYRGAVGKALLANQPETLQNALIEGMRFQRFTANTITNSERLRQELSEVRTMGVAFDEAEGHEDVCCIAAPLLDDTGYPLVAMGISMVKALVPNGARGQVEWIDLVRSTVSSARKTLVPL